MKIEITLAVNGYSVIVDEEDADAPKKIYAFSEEEGEEKRAEAECFLELVQFIREEFGVYYSKHNKHNFTCGVEKNLDFNN